MVLKCIVESHFLKPTTVLPSNQEPANIAQRFSNCGSDALPKGRCLNFNNGDRGFNCAARPLRAWTPDTGADASKGMNMQGCIGNRGYEQQYFASMRDAAKKSLKTTDVPGSSS